MSATAIVGRDNICGASLQPYVTCVHNHEHVFADPNREGALLAGWATLQPRPTVEARPFTEPLVGTESAS